MSLPIGLIIPSLASYDPPPTFLVQDCQAGWQNNLRLKTPINSNGQAFVVLSMSMIKRVYGLPTSSSLHHIHRVSGNSVICPSPVAPKLFLVEAPFFNQHFSMTSYPNYDYA
ncbi:unnamed protein product [Protopolystoma xenopodis]|uniref:Uncharacterized protein n=1 Tax=Protopolystoma xenopodis TaxID=117903 RepID=A0A448WUR0_9PLAT|nr:unnamed protein product [Protopolystoma xenopodis]